ncbi:MAG TPA: glycine zipper 2TM domain-containing protein [Arachidicoccus soli]|nr:glycine zipper 2TM domain-containing protein [Arachidicoccus soli]
MKQLILIFSTVILLMSCNQPGKEAAALQLQHTKDSLTQVIAQQKTIDSMKTINDSIKAIKHHEAVVNNAQSGQTNTQSTQSTDAPRKKGWSNKAKGAVIGAGVGAVTGAIVDRKHRAAGAVIGGVGGAGAGYGVGAILDNKKKKENR